MTKCTHTSLYTSQVELNASSEHLGKLTWQTLWEGWKASQHAIWRIERLPVRRQCINNKCLSSEWVESKRHWRQALSDPWGLLVESAGWGFSCGMLGGWGCWSARVWVHGELCTDLQASASCPSWNRAAQDTFNRHPPHLPRNWAIQEMEKRVSLQFWVSEQGCVIFPCHLQCNWF